MLNQYRRNIKLTLIAEKDKEQAHGWATSLDENDQEVRHYFKADQGRYLRHIKQSGAALLRLQIEGMGIHPSSITIQREFNTFTFKNHSFNPDRAVQMSRARMQKCAA